MAREGGCVSTEPLCVCVMLIRSALWVCAGGVGSQRRFISYADRLVGMIAASALWIRLMINIRCCELRVT